MTADDVQEAAAGLVAAGVGRLDADWHVPAGSLAWSCWETVEHLSEALHFYAIQLVPAPPAVAGGYPYDDREKRPGGPEGVLFARTDQGPAALLRMLNASAGLLVAAVRAADPELRAHHMWGRSDRTGFAAMGVVELVAHGHDVAAAVGLDWSPPEGPCARAVARLFPNAPDGFGAVETLLWATGRASLPGHGRLDDWRWFSEPR